MCVLIVMVFDWLKLRWFGFKVANQDRIFTISDLLCFHRVNIHQHKSIRAIVDCETLVALETILWNLMMIDWDRYGKSPRLFARGSMVKVWSCFLTFPDPVSLTPVGKIINLSMRSPAPSWIGELPTLSKTSVCFAVVLYYSFTGDAGSLTVNRTDNGIDERISDSSSDSLR